MNLIQTIMLLILLFWVPQPDLAVSQPEVNQPMVMGVVTRVIDGDTIEVKIGAEKKMVRYIGLDTPEFHARSQSECFAAEATKRNQELVEGKEVRLVKDLSDKDKYGRLLRYIYANETLINEVLLSEGYAKLMLIAPDVKYRERFKQAESLAKHARLGIWSACQEVSLEKYHGKNNPVQPSI